MADDCVVDDEESIIVTKFLLNTCRLMQPTVHRVRAIVMCVKSALRHRDEAVSIPLITGSVAELYIQPMLSCVGDIDLMYHHSDMLAIPTGYRPPSHLPAEFHSRVSVCEIMDSKYPGYVYLLLSYSLTENTDTDNYDVEQYDSRWYFSSHYTCTKEYEDHGPAVKTYDIFNAETGSSHDYVLCVRCMSWPSQAVDWPTRHRNYGWPESATVDHVVSNGCDVVRVAHRLCRQNEWMNKLQWRLSFSRAEIVLLNSWMPVQQIVYHMLRVFVKTERLTSISDSSLTMMLSNYHIKTLMLWVSELKPRSWWIDDLNLVRICVVLLHNLADWLKNKNYPHYFVNNCSLIDSALHVEIICSQLESITESWISTWFVNNYLRKCAQLCPDRVSRLFDDVSTNVKLQNAVSAVVESRINTALVDLWLMCNEIEFNISHGLHSWSLTAQSCNYWISELSKIDLCFCVYFTANALLHIIYKTTRNGLSDELTGVLATIIPQFVGKQRYSHQLRSVLSLSQAIKLMKVVANNSCSTVQLIEIELSKAYLYRALRCKDSDSDSIYCLANVYLAVLYYITGQYQTAIDHCTLVERVQDHSRCSSYVVQGELLPKIDDNIDNVLGLTVFYQYVRTAALNQQQTQHVSVFTTELFAHFLHVRCMSVTKCRLFTQMISTVETRRYIKSVLHSEQPFIADVLCLQLIKMLAQNYHNKPLAERRRKSTINATELNTTELVELLQQSAVEHLTTYRELEAQKFGSVATIVTTDFEALYAYTLGDYQRCLLLSTQNVRTLLNSVYMSGILMYPEFIQLLDDDIVSLTAMTLIAYPSDIVRQQQLYTSVSMLTLSLYLMTQCQLKLHHSVTSLAQTLDYIEVARRRIPVKCTPDHLILKLTKRKLMIY